jgi:hypothetical protein
MLTSVAPWNSRNLIRSPEVKGGAEAPIASSLFEGFCSNSYVYSRTPDSGSPPLIGKNSGSLLQRNQRTYYEDFVLPTSVNVTKKMEAVKATCYVEACLVPSKDSETDNRKHQACRLHRPYFFCFDRYHGDLDMYQIS